MAPHSSTLAWKIPWTEEPGRLQSMGSLRSQTRPSDFTFTFHFHALEKEMATHSSVLAWRIPGTAEPGGLLSLGSHRVRHDWSDLAAAACMVAVSCLLPSSVSLLIKFQLEVWKVHQSGWPLEWWNWTQKWVQICKSPWHCHSHAYCARLKVAMDLGFEGSAMVCTP